VPPPVALRSRSGIAYHGVAFALVLISLGFVALVWTADGLHGPFSLWDARCYGTEFAPAVKRYRVGYSMAALAGIIAAAGVVATARRRDGLGCLALVLTPLVAFAGWSAAQGAMSSCGA